MVAMRRLSRERLAAGIGVALIEGALGIALLLGLSGRFSAAVEAPRMALLDVRPPPVPVAVIAPQPRTRARSGAAAPRNLRATPTDVVAPPPIIALAAPLPIIVAPVPGSGVAPDAGASDRPGPGSGAGGQGNGGGSGLGGDGDGGGGIPPRRIRGRITDADFPRAVAEAGSGGIVSVRYRVAVDGRVSDCMVTGSSGNAELDALTCRLIQQRFRFAPSRDAAGRKVPSIIVENHSWMIERLPPTDGAG